MSLIQSIPTELFLEKTIPAAMRIPIWKELLSAFEKEFLRYIEKIAEKRNLYNIHGMSRERALELATLLGIPIDQQLNSSDQFILDELSATAFKYTWKGTNTLFSSLFLALGEQGVLSVYYWTSSDLVKHNKSLLLNAPFANGQNSFVWESEGNYSKDLIETFRLDNGKILDGDVNTGLFLDSTLSKTHTKHMAFEFVLKNQKEKMINTFSFNRYLISPGYFSFLKTNLLKFKQTSLVDHLGAQLNILVDPSGITNHKSRQATSVRNFYTEDFSEVSLFQQNLSLTSTGTITISGNTLKKTTGSAAWDSQVYSTNAITSGCRLIFSGSGTTAERAVGLNSDPTLNATQNNLDYAFYLQADGNYRIIESGVLTGILGTYISQDQFKIEYTNAFINYYVNNVLVRSVLASSGLTFYIDSSFYTVSSADDITLYTWELYSSIRGFTAIGGSLNFPGAYLQFTTNVKSQSSFTHDTDSFGSISLSGHYLSLKTKLLSGNISTFTVEVKDQTDTWVPLLLNQPTSSFWVEIEKLIPDSLGILKGIKITKDIPDEYGDLLFDWMRVFKKDEGIYSGLESTTMPLLGVNSVGSSSLSSLNITDLDYIVLGTGNINNLTEQDGKKYYFPKRLENQVFKRRILSNEKFNTSDFLGVSTEYTAGKITDTILGYGANGQALEFDGNTQVTGNGNKSITYLGNNLFAAALGGNKTLSTYILKDGFFILQGLPFSFASGGAFTNPVVKKLTTNTVVVIDDTQQNLTTLSWNGYAWSIVGSTLTLASTVLPAITVLTSSSIALIDSFSGQLSTYSWSGSAWSLVGSQLALSTSRKYSLTALNSTTICLTDNVSRNLKTYLWSGSAWSHLGTDYSIPGTTNDLTLEFLESSGGDYYFLVADEYDNTLKSYRWNSVANLFFPQPLSNQATGQLLKIDNIALASTSKSSVTTLDSGSNRFVNYILVDNVWSKETVPALNKTPIRRSSVYISYTSGLITHTIRDNGNGSLDNLFGMGYVDYSTGKIEFLTIGKVLEQNFALTETSGSYPIVLSPKVPLCKKGVKLHFTASGKEYIVQDNGLGQFINSRITISSLDYTTGVGSITFSGAVSNIFLDFYYQIFYPPDEGTSIVVTSYKSAGLSEITEAGVISTTGNLVAYATFPPVIMDSDDQHLSISFAMKKTNF